MSEVETREYDLVGVLEGVRRSLGDVRAELARGRELGAIEHLENVEWAAGGLAHYEFRGRFRGVLVVNLSNAEAYLGFAPEEATAGRRKLLLPARTWVMLPLHGSTVSIGGASAGEALVAPLSVAPAPAMGALGGPGYATGSPLFADVTDRAARLLGFATIEAAAADDLLVNTSAAWANSAAAGTEVDVDVATPADLPLNGKVLVLVHNPSAVTALTGRPKVRWVDAATGSRVAIRRSLGAAGTDDELDIPVNTTKAFVVEGLVVATGGRITLSNDTVLGVGDGFTARVQVRAL